MATHIFTVPSVGCKIITRTNGTAGEKTVTIQVDCEMSIEECDAVIACISRAKEELEQQ
jgi:hypothetical protein